MLDPAARKARAKKVLAILNKEFPEAACSLDHREPFQLLIATILSAQCTDARVNQVTPGLFAAYPKPRDFAEASQEEIEEAIHSTGFYRQKAKSIRSCCRDLVEKHGGKLPETMAELSALAGVGRKTANVVLGVAFGKPEGVVVDTHVGRIAGKLGLTAHGPKEAVKIERDLNECVPRTEWVAVAHLLIEHGRRTCRARAPRCDECPLFPHCETRS
ncbi:MAG: endonuclease III [bacterium]|nr:endonuclease III [bacterium]